MLQDFISYLEYRVGRSPYVWGAQGQTFKSYEALFAFIERHESGNDEKRAIKYAKKLQAAGVPIEEIQTFDCSGLGMYWLQKNGAYKYDMSANSMYKKCTPISKTVLKKGDWVFRGSSSKKTHIGYVVDDALNVVECKGRDDGVIKGPIKGTYWKYFGRPAVFADEINNGEVAYTRLLKYKRPYIKGADVLKVQTALTGFGYYTDKLDGIFGAKTKAAVKAYQKSRGLEVDGIVGPITWARLFG